MCKCNHGIVLSCSSTSDVSDGLVVVNGNGPVFSAEKRTRILKRASQLLSC